jgi:hypothetical protein
MLGGSRMGAELLTGPPLSAMECLTAYGPKPLIIGGLVGAALVVGAYEAYEHL